MTSVLSRRGQSRVARPACSKYILAIRKWLVGCEQRTPGLEDLRSSVLTVVWLSLASFPGLHRFSRRFRVLCKNGGGLGTRLASQHPVFNLPTHLLITPLPSFSSFPPSFPPLSSFPLTLFLYPCLHPSFPPSSIPFSFLLLPQESLKSIPLLPCWHSTNKQEGQISVVMKTIISGEEKMNYWRTYFSFLLNFKNFASIHFHLRRKETLNLGGC